MRGRTGQVWCLAALGYALVQLGRHGGWVHHWWDWHATDVLCLPLVLGLVLMAQRWRAGDPRLRLPWWHGLVAAVSYGLYFEVILPRVATGRVADPVDAACYFIGWLLFEILLNCAPKKSHDQVAVAPAAGAANAPSS